MIYGIKNSFFYKLFYYELTLFLFLGDKLIESIAVRKSLEYFRGLDVKVSFDLKKAHQGDVVENQANSKMFQLF